MICLSISENGRTIRDKAFAADEVTIGRIEGNDIVVPRGNVSKRHARLIQRDGRLMVVDLKSTNGTLVNGTRISTPKVVRSGDSIQVGDFQFQVRDPSQVDPSILGAGDGVELVLGEEHSTNSEVDQVKQPPRRAEGRRSAVPDPPPRSKERTGQRDAPVRDEGRLLEYANLLREIHNRLIETMDLRRLAIDRLGDEELWIQTEDAIRNIAAQMQENGELPAWIEVEVLIKEILNEALGLGPLEDFLADPSISEIMVNHAKQIYLERDGKLVLSDKTFSSDQAVIGVIERIVAPLGRRIDESVPLVDARLKDGSRVNAIIPPLALKGPSITIRKFKKEAMSVEQLMGFGTFTRQMALFFEMCVQARKNVIVSGGTGSGKTTTLNCLSAFIPQSERIVTVEDAAELQLHQDHWIQLESRPPNIEGAGAITIRDLVRNCLRMRPDRIIVGECRGGETLDMLQAMNTGHDGSLTTVHANTPRDALSRLETMVLMSGMDLPIRAIREQVSSAVDIIVQQSRFSDGSRRITHVTEITGMEVDVVTLQDIFLFKQEGFDEQGRIKGHFVSTGFIPRFYDDLQKRGIPVDMSIFHGDF